MEDRSRDSHQQKCRSDSAETARWSGGTRGMRPEGEPGMWVRPCGVHPNQQEGKWKDGNLSRLQNTKEQITPSSEEAGGNGWGGRGLDVCRVECIHGKTCSVAKSCLSFCDPMDSSMPGFPVLHHLWSLLTLMSTESVMSSNHLILRPRV